MVPVQTDGVTHAPDLQHADLLTQAMSELTQNIEYRSHGTDFQITLPAMNTLQAGGGEHEDGTQPIIVTTPGDGQTTLDLSVLGQALMQGGFTATLITDPSVVHASSAQVRLHSLLPAHASPTSHN